MIVRVTARRRLLGAAGLIAMIFPSALSAQSFWDRLPQDEVIDFAFGHAVADTVAESAGADIFTRLSDNDVLYEGGAATALQLSTFLGHAILLTLRGMPTIYSGDEQGFAGNGNDQGSREDIFTSKVANHNDNKLVGTTPTMAQSNFDQKYPLYKALTKLSAVRLGTLVLTRGKQLIRNYDEKPDLFAVLRIDPTIDREVVIAFNTSTTTITRNV